MSKYIDGTSVDLASFSGDDIIVVVEQSGQRDTYATINQLRALLDTLPIVGGTANGVLYLNGSKVVTSGSALTFDGTNLGVGASSVTPIFGRTVQVGSGASENTVSLVGPTGAGFVATIGNTFSVTARGGTSLVFGANDVEQMRLTSTGLGIGTNNPTAKLQVSGTFISATNSGTASTSVIGGISGVSNGYEIIQSVSDALTYRWRNGANSTIMTLDTSGNLGLGVTPSAWGTDYKALQIGGGASAALSYKNFVTSLSQNVYSTNTDDISIVSGNAAKYELNGSGQHVWKTAATPTAGNAISFTQAMTLDANGNLGVGDTIPVYKLSVQTSVAGDIARFSDGTAQTLIIGTASTGLYYNNANSGYHAWLTGGTERVRIKSTGQLRFIPLAADPSGAEAGDVYYNSGTNKLRLYDGSTWVDLN